MKRYSVVDRRKKMEEIKKLKDLVNSQVGVVSSRTIIDKDTGTITLFAFDKNHGLSEHAVPFDAMVYILDGKAEITISGKKYTLNTGKTIVMPANKPHKVYATDKFKMLLVMIKE